MEAHVYRNKAKTITVLDVEGKRFPFIDVSGNRDKPEALLKHVFDPECQVKCFRSNIEAERFAQKQLLGQVDRNLDYYLGRTQYEYTFQFSVWDVFPAVYE